MPSAVESELNQVVGDLARLERHSREVRRGLRRLQDTLGRELGTFELAAGESLNMMEVLAFLRVAIGSAVTSGVRITVTAQTTSRD